jgi:ribosomal protein S18 acetylase RimI-like enzyme
MGIQCRRADKGLSDRQLQEIAGLIYDTDPYIYPAMFKDRKEAEIVLPRMIRSGDRIFRTEHMFIAVDEKEVIGVLLWKRGPVSWNTAVYEKCGGNGEHIARVVREYFNLFAETKDNTATMVRIGVREDMRRNHIGSLLMETFMQEEAGPYELYVLINNTEAVRFFEKDGFRIRETRPGFSLDYSAYPCYWMVRK